MKFFVKKEKKQDPLLQTYFVSLLSLVLCVTMFLGTTFAWFSSDVTSQDNQIFVGTLSVKLSHWDKANAKWAEVNAEHKILNPDIRWEPGYTTVEWLKLENTGDLSLNYRLKMASTAANAETVLGTIGKYFTVYANTKITQATYTMPDSFEAMIAQEDWVEVGTLDQVMLGKSIVAGEMKQIQTTTKDANGNDVVNTPAVEFAFAIHMDKAADKAVMGQKLEGISVKLEAWQNNHEEDAFDSEYDHLITSAEELEAAFAAGGRVVLLNNIDMADTTLVVYKDKSVRLDLNGKTIEGKNPTAAYDCLVRVMNGGVLNITDDSDGANGQLVYTAGTQGATIHLEGKLNLYAGTVKQIGDGISFGVDARPNAWSEAFTAPTEFYMYGGKVDGGDSHAVRLSVNSSATYVNDKVICVIEDGELVGWDGVFMQAFDGNPYRPISLTVNSGSLTGEVSAIRVYAPTPDPVVVVGGDQTPFNITINGGTFVSKGTANDTDRWHDSKIVKFSSGDKTVLETYTEIVNPNGLTAGK